MNEVLTFTIKVELPNDEFSEKFNYKISENASDAEDIILNALGAYCLHVKDVELKKISCEL